jgi:hypothetical protein
MAFLSGVRSSYQFALELASKHSRLSIQWCREEMRLLLLLPPPPLLLLRMRMLRPLENQYMGLALMVCEHNL